MLRYTPAHGWPAAAFAARWNACPLRPANDNGAQPGQTDPVLAAALRLFAASGLGAAARAEELADDAYAAGDLVAAARWVDVCRMLDGGRARRYLARRG